MKNHLEMTPQGQANDIMRRVAALTWSRVLRNDHMPIEMNGFKMDFYRRITSSSTAKRISYQYRGLITFKYGPERKEFTVNLPLGENRSLKKLIFESQDYIISRLKQHFELPDLKIQLINQLAGWA